MLRRLVGVAALLALAAGPTGLGAQEAASGRIQGQIVDSESGEPLVGAEVYVQGTQLGALSDLDGNYRILDVPAGTQALVVNYLGYAQKTVTGVVVEEGAVASQDLSLVPEAIAIEGVEVVVSAEAERASVAGAIDYQRAAAQVVNGISSEEISRTPDSNAADAVRRVSGTSLVDGKYVYVRGLGERYSTARLDGSQLPTPEPEKRVLPLDLFPASFVESLFTVKSYTADLPGDFAGGLVDIRTKDIPDEGFLRLSTSAGYNTNLGDGDFRTYEGGDLDFLGFDDGTRSLPGKFPERIDAGALPQEAAAAHALFDGDFRTFAVEPGFEEVNKSFALSLGDRSRLFGRDGGYLLGASYSISSNSREQNDFYPSLAADLFQYDYDARIGTREVSLGLIGGYSLNLTEASRLSLKVLGTQSTEDETRQVTGPFDQSTSGFAFINRQQFVERTLISSKLKGEHKLGILGGAKLEWDGSYAVALRDEPDTRESAYLRPFAEEGVFGFNEAGNNSRFFSELTDHMTQGGLELSRPLTLLGREATLDTGLRGGWRTRDFAARRFSYESPRPEFRQVPAEELFTTENVAAGNIRFFENTEPNDEYEATELSSSAFASLGVSLADPLWVTAGLRVEQNDTEVDSFDPRSGAGVEALSADLATVELLPTVNLQWSLGERQSVRLAAARTIVRPQFRELAPFRYDDYLESTFGNPFLENGEVYNFDLRWSLFPAVGEIVTVGAFYKQFNDPIEIVRIPTAGNNVGSPEPYNGPSARNYGVELELRHDLSNLNGALRGLGFSANAAFVESEVEQDEPVEVFFGSVSGSGPDILEPEVFTNSSRPMYGQSPYLVNASLYYTTPGSGTTATLLYNGVGKRLAQVGTNGFDDILELDRHSFDAALEQSLFNAMTARLALENLTDAVYRFRLGEFTTREYKKGREVSLKLSYAF